MPFLLPIVGLLGTGAAAVVGSRLFDQKDGTVTVATPGDDVKISPAALAIIGVGAYFLFFKK